jgi:two-component system, sensor histidine kinase RetS
MRLCLSRFKSWVFHTLNCKQDDSKNHSQLMERLSHELRTSLTGIVGYSEFVESTSAEPMVNFTAKIIRESSQNLARASNSFFDLYRLEQGQVKQDCSVFSISELVRDVVRLTQKQALERDVNLFFTCSTETFLLDMYADAQRVRQIVDALVFGAVQSAGQGQSVHVDVSLDADKSLMKLMLVSLDALPGDAPVGLLKEFWHSGHYKFRLQEGPGVELALAKSMIYFLKGQAEYQVSASQPPRLVVKLPMHHDETRGMP